MSINQRIYQFIQYKNITLSSIETLFGYSRSSFSRIVKNDKAINSDRIEDFLTHFEDLSAEWLLRGKGSMLIEEPASTPQQECDCEELKQQVQDLRDLNGLLKEKVIRLEKG